MVKGLMTCKVCGRDFALNAEDHYIARDVMKKGGVVPAIIGDVEATLWDAFDCPHCGCQNVIQERKCPCDYGICDECDMTGENEEEEEDA